MSLPTSIDTTFFDKLTQKLIEKLVHHHKLLGEFGDYTIINRNYELKTIKCEDNLKARIVFEVQHNIIDGTVWLSYKGNREGEICHLQPYL